MKRKKFVEKLPGLLLIAFCISCAVFTVALFCGASWNFPILFLIIVLMAFLVEVFSTWLELKQVRENNPSRIVPDGEEEEKVNRQFNAEVGLE